MIAKPLVMATSVLLFAFVTSTAAASYIQQGAKLVGTGAVGSAQQGRSMALSADGNTAVVGGLFDNASAGAAWVYTRSGGVWSQQGAKLVGTGAAGNAQQGCSVAVSADGNTAVLGGNGDNGYAGAAWAYTRSGGVWSQQGAKLVGMGAVGRAYQGCSVAVSADGNTAVIGGYQDNGQAGAAWVYTRSGGAWSQQGAKLVGTGAVGTAWQGCSVAVSADGNTAVVGGYVDDDGAGAAWVFTRSSGVWNQQGPKLVGTDAVGVANQGYSVSVSADGNTAIVGGCLDNGNAGAAWVFARSGGVWSQQGPKLVGTGAVGTVEQGYSVAMTADGNTAVVGGLNDSGGAGAAWVYTRSGGVWSQQGAKLVGTGAAGKAYEGFSVAVSADGNTAGMGGPIDDDGAGAAWVFIVDPSPTIASITDVPNDQGGKVHVLWDASVLDAAPVYGISEYTLWRRITTTAAAQAAEHGARLAISDDDSWQLAQDHQRRAIRVTTEGTQSVFWEFVASVPARGASGYGYMAPTTSDSLPGSIPWNVFFVDAQAATSSVFYVSAVDSGYSVDNLPPGPPAPVAAVYAGGATYLHWGASAEADFATFRLYRGNAAGFVPGPGNLVTTQPDTGYADIGAAGSYYKLSTVDVHGNESGFALITPGMTAGVSGGGPLAFALEGVRPNPTKGNDLNVAFVLPTGAAARLELLDLSGRRVLAREVGSLGAGRHVVNLAEGRKVAPGMYWVGLTQGAKRNATRVVVIE